MNAASRSQQHQTPWTDVFSHSSLHPTLFYVRDSRGRDSATATPYRIEEIAIGYGVPYRNGLIRGFWDAWDHGGFGFLDGGFTYVLGGDGWLYGGAYVIGFHAFRFLCAELGLRPPRRLKSEPAPLPRYEQLRARIVDETNDPEIVTRLRLTADTLYRLEDYESLQRFAEGTLPLHEYQPVLGDLSVRPTPRPSQRNPTPGPRSAIDSSRIGGSRSVNTPAGASPTNLTKPSSARPKYPGLRVCLKCFTLRGVHDNKEHRCECQPKGEDWQYEDWQRWGVTAEVELCHLCGRRAVWTARGRSTGICPNCRTVNERVGAALGEPHWPALPIGRYSLLSRTPLSGRNIPTDAVFADFAATLGELGSPWQRLPEWRVKERRRLFESVSWKATYRRRIPLDEWLTGLPASRGASVDTFCRFVGADLPDLPEISDLREDHRAFTGSL